MMMFLKADSCFWYIVPLGFVVLLRSLTLVENLCAASQDEESGCEAGEPRCDTDFLQYMDNFGSRFWSEIPSNILALC